MSPTFVEGSLSRFDDMRRCREIGFANLQVYNALAFGLEGLCPDQNIEGRFDPDPAHTIS